MLSCIVIRGLDIFPFSLSLGTVLKFAVGLNYDNYWYFDRRLVLVVSSILLIFPLCFSKTIKFLQIPR